MTNYNERLDEVLKTSHYRIRTRILRDAEIYQSHIAQSEYEAKQAITDLFLSIVSELDPTGATALSQQIRKAIKEKYEHNL